MSWKCKAGDVGGGASITCKDPECTAKMGYIRSLTFRRLRVGERQHEYRTCCRLLYSKEQRCGIMSVESCEGEENDTFDFWDKKYLPQA